jgi:hypothetical protein
MSPDPAVPLHFVGVGPQRTGTTWLDEVLRQHPGLCLPRQVKETMFFDRDYERGLSAYAAHFRHRRPGQLCGEFGPTYFDAPEAPERIARLNPACRIIVGLRDPVERALSLYKHYWMLGQVRGGVREAVQAMPRLVTSGRYTVHLPRWRQTFASEQLHFIWLDNIASDPQSVLDGLCAFLGEAPMKLPPKGEQPIGTATVPAHRLVARITAWGARQLRARGWHHLVETGKALGMRRVFRGGRRAPDVTREDHAWLESQLRDEVAFAKQLRRQKVGSHGVGEVADG